MASEKNRQNEGPPSGISVRFLGEGEAGKLIRSFDWRKTSLGALETWPETLKGYVSMILTLPSPAIIFWGETHVQIYNDGYSVIMGPRHPQFLGSTYQECWPDTYPAFHPRMDRVLQHGEVVEVDRALIPLTRYGFLEDAYFTFSFSPLRDDRGQILGVLQLVSEVTAAVVAERRAETLRTLGVRMDDGSAGSLVQNFIEVLKSSENDIVSSVLFLPSAEGGELVFRGATGVSLGHPNAAELENLQKLAQDVHDGVSSIPYTAHEPWLAEHHAALILPLVRSEHDVARGVVILASNPRLKFDQAYMTFFKDVAREMAISLAIEQERELGRRLELALESAQMGTWHIDVKTQQLAYSAKVAEFLALEPQKGVETTSVIQRVVHPDDIEAATQTLEHSMKNKVPYAHEYRIRRKNGEIRWLQSWGKVSLNEKGETQVLSGVTLDITDRKRAAIALQESEQRFRAMADTVPQIIWMADQKTGGVTYASRQWYDYTGVKPEDAYADAWMTVVHPDDLEPTVNKWTHSLQTKNPLEIEYRLKGKDGAYRHHLIKGVPIADSDGKVVSWLGTITNVHDLKTAQSALTAQAEKTARLLESTPTPFFSMNSQWIVTYINPAAEEALELAREKVVGLSVWQIFPGLNDTPFAATYRRAMTERIKVPAEDYYPDSKKWYQTWAYPLEDGIGVSFLDITHLKSNELALSEAVRARDEFLSIASHELKTPLTSLKIQIQTAKRLKSRSPDQNLAPGRAAQLIESTLAQTDRIIRLVDDMLDISRISTGKLSLVFEPTDIAALISQIAEQLASQFEVIGTSLSFDCLGPIVANIDSHRIEQVIVNLLTNGIKYGAAKPVVITAEKIDHRVRVSVIDQGIGLAEENHARIFERFERAISASSVSGLGLGLFISKQIVEAHHGHIGVKSALGLGSTFYFEVPLEQTDSLSITTQF